MIFTQSDEAAISAHFAVGEFSAVQDLPLSEVNCSFPERNATIIFVKSVEAVMLRSPERAAMMLTQSTPPFTDRYTPDPSAEATIFEKSAVVATPNQSLLPAAVIAAQVAPLSNDICMKSPLTHPTNLTKSGDAAILAQALTPALKRAFQDLPLSKDSQIFPASSTVAAILLKSGEAAIPHQFFTGEEVVVVG